MKRYRLLPLGVDLGRSRLRVAVSEHGGRNETRLLAVASRDVPLSVADDSAMVGALLEEMCAELGVRERRCVAALGAPLATVRVMRFPKMTWTERLKAAKFEAARVLPSAVGQNVRTRVHPADARDQLYAVGAAPSAVIDGVVSVLKAGRLRPIGIDQDAFALRRVLPETDAIVDIGSNRSTVHVFGSHPLSYPIACGGEHVSRAIARELSIDERTAERRKRILGASGAGPDARAELVSSISTAIEKGRSRTPVRRIVLVGNAARLPGLAEDLEEATASIVELPVAELLTTSSYPADVLRVAAPDWTLAAALTTWAVAS